MASAHAQVSPGDVLIGEDENNYYYMSRPDYQGSAAQKYGMEYCRNRKAVTADQRAIREMGFALDAQRFEMFENVAREQKAALEQKIVDALFDHALYKGLAWAEDALRGAESLNPWNVNKAVSLLRKKGYGNETVIAALRGIASQKNKPAMFAAYKEFVEVAKKAKVARATGLAAAKEPGNAGLLQLLGALKTVQGNPALGEVITAVDMGENLVYLGYVTGQVDKLTTVSDDKLAKLSSLSKRLKDHVGAMHLAQRRWQKATGHLSARPKCDS